MAETPPSRERRDGGETIGPLLQRLREQANRSQSEQAFLLSDLTGRPVTRHDVSRWENEGRLVGPSWQAALATSFGIAESVLRHAVIRAKVERRRQESRESRLGATQTRRQSDPQRSDIPSGIRRYIATLRKSLDLYDLPEDGPVPTLNELRRRTAKLVRWRLDSEYGKLAAELPRILPELTRALFSSRVDRRPEVASCLVQAYRAADAIADKFGMYDLSGRTIGVMDWAARQADSRTTLAISSYVRGETFFATSQFALGRRVLEKATENVQSARTTGESAAYGALHMRAAVMAARAGEADNAREHLRAAHDAARCVADGIYGGTAFGPGSVRIHEVSLAVSLGEPAAALAVAAEWEPGEGVPAERRSHFYVDRARAQLQVDRPSPALLSLQKAWSIAPQHIAAHPQVVRMIPELVGRGGSTEAGVRDFCLRTGISFPT